jgi:hypothetical protein
MYHPNLKGRILEEGKLEIILIGLHHPRLSTKSRRVRRDALHQPLQFYG